MLKTIVATGKTIDNAIESAISELGISRDDAIIEVLETPVKGFLGIGSSPAKVSVSVEIHDEGQNAEQFLSSVFEKMNVIVNIDITQSDNEMKILLKGDDIGIIIGRRGETLDALQYLTALVVNRGKEDYVRVTIDTENYRKKREETLNRLANKLAGKVLKYKKSITLEPMNPYERRIIHAALQDTEGITTFSTGIEPNRKVVIALSNRPQRGRYNNRQKSYSNYEKRPQKQINEEEKPE
jgi:spoIIIJ-associated protein